MSECVSHVNGVSTFLDASRFPCCLQDTSYVFTFLIPCKAGMPCLIVSMVNHSTNGSIIGDEGYIGRYRNCWNIQNWDQLEPFVTKYWEMLALVLQHLSVCVSTCLHVTSREALSGYLCNETLGVIWSFVETFRLWLKSGKNNGSFTWKIQVFMQISRA
jgi:hypothetical protein